MNRPETTLKKLWLWSFIAEFASRLGPIVLVLLYLPYLGAEAAGTTLISLSYTMTVWLLVDLGLGFYGIRLIAEGDKDSLVVQSQITKARLILSIPCALILMTLLAVIGVPTLVATGFAIYLVFRAMAGDWRLRGEERFKDLAIVCILSSVLQLVSAAILVRPISWEYFASLPWVVWSFTLAICSWRKTGLNHRLLIRMPVWPSLNHIKISYGFSTTNGLSVLFGQAPILILSQFYAPAALAQFALIHRVILSSNLFFQTLGAAIFPRLVRNLQVDSASAMEVVRQAFGITAILSLAIAVLIAAVYMIPFTRNAYLTEVSGLTIAGLTAFLLLRSLRENSMRLLLAQGATSRASIDVLVGFFTFAALISSTAIVGYTSISIVSVSFALAESIILFRMLISNKVNRALKAIDHYDETRLDK